MRYIIALPGGEYVDIDRNSGGYPYPVKDPSRAYIWADKEKALDYMGKFNRSQSYGLDLAYLCTIEYVIKPINDGGIS